MPPLPEYAELHALSNFSFLRGASHPEEQVKRAHDLSYRAIALTDRDGLYGAVRVAKAARDLGDETGRPIRAILGSEVTLEDGGRIVLLARSARGYKNLCQILSAGRLSRPKGQSAVKLATVAGKSDGLLALEGGEGSTLATALLRDDREAARRALETRLEIFGRSALFLELQNHRLPEQAFLRARLASLGDELHVPRVATSCALYARPADRILQDVLTCIREKTTLDEAGTRILPNGELYLRERGELATLFHDHPHALRNTLEVAERCTFDLEKLDYRLPLFDVPTGETPFSFLHRLAYEGARHRYRPLTPQAARQVAHELDVIERLDLAGYFLIVWDIVRFCREKGILCQGRGSAANSAVCFCLGISAVDPVGLDLLFERFLSEERKEPPDIDLDIAHAYREEVIQYVYQKYGRQHAGMVCEVITYHARSAVRDAGKVLGLSQGQVDRAAKALHFGSEGSAMLEKAAAAGDLGLDPESPRVRMLSALVRRMEGFPRHLSIHVGGMIITRDPLSCVVPIENAAMKDRTVVQWDKDDVARVGLVKIDLLGLGMLTLIQEAIALVKRHEGVEVDLAHLPMDDPRVYDMLCRADTVGVFQVESRAQMNTLPRVKPRCFYDLVIEIALIRPGPIQGDMVHPYLRRRAGREKVTYLHPSLEPVLKRTLGVPLFQEQGMKVAVAAAGFTAAEADELRRAMGFKRSTEAMQSISRRLTEGMRRNKIPDEAAEKIRKQLTAFASYGFPESHAASFALLVYASAYLKHHHPLAFTCALLNAQPMGFYSPSTIVQDARRHGVPFLPVNVRASEWDCTLEGGAVRIGFRYVRGIGEETKEPLCAALQRRPFLSIEDFVVKTKLSRAALDHLAELGAFDDFSLDRRQVLWRLLALAPHLTVLRGAAAGKSPGLIAPSVEPPASGQKRRDDDDGVRFRPMSRVEETEADYALTGLSTKRHPLEFLREDLATRGVLTAASLREKRHGERVLVAGLAICRQHPGTAKGFTFLTLEDETGMINVVVRPRYFEKYRLVIRLSPILLVSGILEREDGVINVLGDRFEGQDELSMLRQDMARKVPARDFR